MTELEPRAAAASERVQQIAERLAELEALVCSASPAGEQADALERLHAASTRRVAADQRERSLVEGVPELDALLATAREREARGERLMLSDDEHATLVAELREARARAEALMLREQELSAELTRLGGVRTVGDVEGELRAVEDELAGVKRERDRLVLAAAVVRRAEREVRERYAPAWLQSASRYLEAITHGRYTGIAIVETPGGEPVLEVTRAGEAMPVRVGPPLSRGTLEQIYVAVRLALVDAIDAEARLPMFLDELFAHWDANRLDALVRVLGAVEGRQVVVSTCHAALADRLERSCGARVDRARRPRRRSRSSARCGASPWRPPRPSRKARPCSTCSRAEQRRRLIPRDEADSHPRVRCLCRGMRSKVPAWPRPPSVRRSPPPA